MKNKLLLIFLIFFQFSFAQEKIIHGRISANGNNVEGINIVNLVNEKSAVSDAKGEFYILAKAEDLLVLSSINFEYKRKIISEEDLKLKTIEIPMVPKVGQIDEVVITKYRNINAVDLGILSKPAKVYTPAERRLKTASSYDLTVGTSNSVSFDAILNSISGRTSMLKKELEVERKQFAIASLDQYYEDVYFTENLKIPSLNVSGFKYFAVENRDLITAIKAKNKTLSDLILIQLAEKYLELLKDEK